MSRQSLKKWALLLTFWMALHTTTLRADLVGPYGTSPITFDVDANGLLSATGTYGTGTLSLSGAGTRMFWYPGKAAFRAGGVSGTDWNNTNVGAYSVAFGYDAIASGSYSTAFGLGNTASGYLATVFGASTTASGVESVTFGFSTSATAYASIAAGYHTSATAYGDFAMGRYNVGGVSPTSWNPIDPLFEVGNGTSSVPADAFVVYKNGDATVQGTLAAHTGLICPQQGDLSMGSFTAGTAP